MGRRKAAQNATISPWLSAKNDCREGRFLQIGNSLLLSPQIQQLSVGARMMYLCMAMESGGKREFTFSRSVGEKYGIPDGSFKRYIKELKENSFIDCIEDNHTTRKPNVYAFSFDWKV